MSHPSSRAIPQSQSEDRSEDRTCHQFACQIQYCLERNNYQEKWCHREIDQYKQCVERVKAKKRN